MYQHFVKASLCVSTFCKGVVVCINILSRRPCVYQHFVKVLLCVSTFCKGGVVCNHRISILEGPMAVHCTVSPVRLLSTRFTF